LIDLLSIAKFKSIHLINDSPTSTATLFAIRRTNKKALAGQGPDKGQTLAC
jgi:hypothetical protein